MPVLLDEMRRALAIDVECFDDDDFDRIRRRSQGSLRAGGRSPTRTSPGRPPWSPGPAGPAAPAIR